MRTETVRLDVELLSPSDFVQRFPHYTAVQGAERRLFDLIMTSHTFIRASALTDVLGVPAVAAAADEVAAAFGGRKDWGFVKQLSGAIVCSLMEKNGYRRSHKKRSVPRPGWSKGEVYERQSQP